MRLRDRSIDDAHLELLLELDDLDRPWARSVRAAANRLYRRKRTAEKPPRKE
jgi:hypothetical protein